MLSDVYRSNTLMGINTKAIQAIGRLRSSDPKAIYHITSLKNEDEVEMRRYEDIKNSRMKMADDCINTYNQLFGILNNINLPDEVFSAFYSSISVPVITYGDISSSGQAEVNYFKIDSAIDNDVAIEQYLNKKSVVNAWEKSGFQVSANQDDSVLSKRERDILQSNRISKREKNIVIYEKFMHLIPMQIENSKTIFFGNEELDKLIDSHPEEYKIYKILGYDRIAELNFNSKSIREAAMLQQVNNIEVSSDLYRLINLKFQTFKFYSSEEIKSDLIGIYKSLGIEKNIKGSYITKFFNVDEKSVKTLGKTVRGYFLRNKLYNL